LHLVGQLLAKKYHMHYEGEFKIIKEIIAVYYENYMQQKLWREK